MQNFETLQDFIYKKIKSEANKNSELKSTLSELETRELNRDFLNRYKEYKALEAVKNAYENSDFYRSKYEGKINNFDDFFDLPLLTPEEIKDNHFKFLTTSRKNIFRGFTDRSKRILFEKKELQNIIEAISAGLKSVGMEEKDVLQVIFPKESRWGCHELVKKAGKKIGETKFSGELPAKKQVKKIKKHSPDVLIGSNPYIRKLTETIEKLDIDLDFLDLDSVILSRGCIYFPFNEEIRRDLEKTWGCDVYDHYGTTETGFAVSMECKEKDGLHVNEKDYLIEIIDPETGERVQDGEGEIVITTLTRRGMPLIRYRSNDISEILEKKHSCGSLLQRLNGISGEVEKSTLTEMNFLGF